MSSSTATTPSSLKRFFCSLVQIGLVLIGLALIGVALSGCSGGDDSTSSRVDFEFTGDAAVVNGKPLPAAAIEEELDVLRLHPEFSIQYIGLTDVDQVGRDEPSPTAVATILSGQVLLAIAQAELAAQAIVPGDEDRRTAETLIRANFGSAFDDLSDDFRRRFISRNAELLALDASLSGPPPAETEIRAVFDADPTARATSCVRHILFSDLVSADLALAELNDGGDFPTVAQERSLDTGSGAIGGDLGCLGRGQYIEAFDDAVWDTEVGVLAGPVETDFGVHLFEVYDRRGLIYEEVRAQIVTELTAESGTSLATWLTESSDRYEVMIDERYGTWDAELVAVEPIGGGASIIEFEPGVPGDEPGVPADGEDPDS